jgi:hypothetical protein
VSIGRQRSVRQSQRVARPVKISIGYGRPRIGLEDASPTLSRYEQGDVTRSLSYEVKIVTTGPAGLKDCVLMLLESLGVNTLYI